MHAEQWEKAEPSSRGGEARTEPGNGHYGLGQVYMSTKRFPEAVSAISPAATPSPRTPRAAPATTWRRSARLDDEIRALEDEKTLLVSGV